MRWSRVSFHVLAVLSLVGALGGCAVNPSTGRSQLILLPADQVAAMGVEAKPQLVQEFGGEVRSTELADYVRDVGNRLARQVEPEFAGIEWEFTTLESPVVNAFALPGGKVFITRGLLERFHNEAQVAGVLGHEIGHVTGRHVDERLSQTLIAQLGLEVLGAYSESQIVGQGASVLAQGTLLKFGRDQEAESDRQGMKYMTAAGYDPRGMRQLLEVLLDASAGSSRQPEILSTHPHPESRLEDVQRLLETEYAFTRGDTRYKLQQGRFERLAMPHLR